MLWMNWRALNDGIGDVVSGLSLMQLKEGNSEMELLEHYNYSKKY
jgi:hypothetical protein